jgi:hypothetical protein
VRSDARRISTRASQIALGANTGLVAGCGGMSEPVRLLLSVRQVVLEGDVNVDRLLLALLLDNIPRSAALRRKSRVAEALHQRWSRRVLHESDPSQSSSAISRQPSAGSTDC